MASTSIFFVLLVLLAISLSLVLCEGTEEKIDQHEVRVHHRVRRMTGYRQKCVPVKKNLCALFTHNQLTKSFCFPITIKECTGLDQWITNSLNKIEIIFFDNLNNWNLLESKTSLFFLSSLAKLSYQLFSRFIRPVCSLPL